MRQPLLWFVGRLAWFEAERSLTHRWKNPVDRLILHLYAFSNHEPRQTNHGGTARSSFLFIMEDADFRRMVDGLFKFVLDFLARFAVEFADDVDGDEREEEARYDFVEAEPGELFPDEDGQAADDDAGQGAILGHAFPVQGQEDGRAEGGTEAGPGVGYHGQDVAVRVEGQDDGAGGDDEDGQAADVYEFFFTGILADEGVIKILGDSRCRDQELR